LLVDLIDIADSSPHELPVTHLDTATITSTHSHLDTSSSMVSLPQPRPLHGMVFFSSDSTGIDILRRSCYNSAMMSTQTSVEISSYRLPVVIERVNGSYQATSPVLDGFLVLADTLDEVLALAPGVARALLEAMQDRGVKPSLPIEEVRLPTQIDVLVPA
jgi:predicted RNase H-like HicB family nuclease